MRLLEPPSLFAAVATVGLTLFAYVAIPNSIRPDVVNGLAAGGTATGLKFRGRKWNYSPVTDAEYSNADFIHIKGGCAEDTSLTQPQSNFSFEHWFKFDPTETWVGFNIPHIFAMAQEYNFWMMFTVTLTDGTTG
ncbi:hypothetical protein HDU67_004145, partial [Dinochytrium kinnereticum]